MASLQIALQCVKINEGWSGGPQRDNNGAIVRNGINQAYWPDMPPGFYSGAMNDADAADAAAAHYRANEWAAIQGDKIPSQPLANNLLDAAVNTGVGGAVETLQGVLNFFYRAGLAVDGGMGPETLAALLAACQQDSGGLESRFVAARIGYYVGKSLEPQGHGWLVTWLQRLAVCQSATGGNA